MLLDRAQDTAHNGKTEGDAMDLEQRIKELETRIDEQERKRRVFRNQFLALQFVLTKLLPVISSAPKDAIERAMAAARDHANVVLSALKFDADDVQDVLASISDLRLELLNDRDAMKTDVLH